MSPCCTCLFLSVQSAAALSAGEIARLHALIRSTPRLGKAFIHVPASARDPYEKNAPSPALVLQLYFNELADLEAALSPTGCFYDLMLREKFPALAQAEIAHQAMLVRPFAVPDPNTPREEPCCSYLVSYEGEAEDLNAWHAHYMDNHTRHMAMLPDIRELEVYTRLDWMSRLPWAKSNFMQRNKVAFDSTDALCRALNSPVRREMRADYETFPRFTGPTNHYTLKSHLVRPQ